MSLVSVLFSRSSLRSTAFRTAQISLRSTGVSMQVSAPWSSKTARSLLLQKEEVNKLRRMDDEQYADLDLIPDFEPEDSAYAG